MCGLAGLARHPKAPNLELSLAIFSTLLERNEVRGHHATGVAAVGGSKPFLMKKAVEATKFVKSDLYRERVMGLAGNTPILIGHTRHATHANAHQDEAAHPFHIGKVVGAHNGVIHNWRSIEEKVFAKNDGHVRWINDSQAAFAVLDKWSDPVRATDELDGWWALTWTRDKHLFMCRTGVDLHAAYVGSLRTMFWSSTYEHLNSTLRAAGIDTFDIWKINANTIYKYDPTQFTAESANGTKRDAPFRGIGQERRGVQLGSSGRGDDVRGGYSTVRTYPSGRTWDATLAREVEAPVVEGASKDLASLGKFGKEMQRVWDYIAKLNTRLAAVEGENEQLRAEVDHLYALLNEDYPERFEQGDDDDASSEALPDDDTEPTDGPYADDAQLTLADEERARRSRLAGLEPGSTALEYTRSVQAQQADRAQAVAADRRCAECHEGEQPGRTLLTLPEGGYVHDTCVMTLGE